MIIMPFRTRRNFQVYAASATPEQPPEGPRRRQSSSSLTVFEDRQETLRNVEAFRQERFVGQLRLSWHKSRCFEKPLPFGKYTWETENTRMIPCWRARRA